MRKGILYIFLVFGFISCDNELNLVDEYKDIPIVYGILSLPETDQYIRLEKGFVDPTISGLQLAQIPDSLYYENPIVSIHEASTGNNYKFEQIDGADVGLERDPGIFATDPNILYSISKDVFLPIEGDTYTLQIQRSESDTMITASIKMVEGPTIVRPSLTGAASLDFRYVIPTQIRWRGEEGSGLYDLHFIVHYKERDVTTTNNFENKSFRWNVFSNYDEEEYELAGTAFFGAMASELDDNPNLARKFRHLDMVLTVGGEEVFEYVRIGQANSGLTSSQETPTYTNLSEGRGVFSSKQTVRNDNILITATTLDSLINGIYTKQLNFQE